MKHINKFSNFVLHYPGRMAIALLLVGIFGALVTQAFLDQNFFSRFGSLIVGAGLLVFGYLNSELLIAAQTARAAGSEEQEREKASRIRKALSYQTLVIFWGTIQWGFGGLMFDECVQC